MKKRFDARLVVAHYLSNLFRLGRVDPFFFFIVFYAESSQGIDPIFLPSAAAHTVGFLPVAVKKGSP